MGRSIAIILFAIVSFFQIIRFERFKISSHRFCRWLMTKLTKQNKLVLMSTTCAVLTFGIVICLIWAYCLVSPFTGIGFSSHYKTYTSLIAISQPMQDATVAMEDGKFYQHHGFDWEAMERALRVDLQAGSVEQGGSTITQQLAKNLFLTKDRTILRKLLEVPLTCELERQLSKKRILELYLNTIDYGMGQHGLTAATQYYFHKIPAQLTLSESAILVGMVSDPMQQQLNLQRVETGKQAALGRIEFFFPARYSPIDIDKAQNIPLDHLVYPYKDALDRGATDQIPAIWHGVSFYFFADPDMASPVMQVSASLKPELAYFLDEAYRKYHLVGLDHLGVYNDRPTRQSQKILSAHAYGQAIDISGFRFADRSHIRVEDHTNPAVAARLATMEMLLKKHFDVVVDWRDDPQRHQTHFHAEVHGPRIIHIRDSY